MFWEQNIEKIGTVQHFGDLGQLLQGYSSAQQLLGKGFLTKLLISVRKTYLRAPPMGFLCLGALGTGFPTETTNLDEESRNTLGEALPGLQNAVLSQSFLCFVSKT